MKLTKRLLPLLILSSFAANAQWYSSEGRAVLNEENIDQSRSNAISDAMVTVLRSAGTSAESVQVIQEGVLEVDKLMLKTNGEIHDMRIVHEEIIGGYYTVEVEADIYPFSTCPQEKYAKSIFVGPFSLEDRKDAQLGAIYDSDEVITKRLFKQLKGESNKLDPRHVMTQQIAFTNNSEGDIELQTLKVAKDVATKYDVQYLVFGVLKDMSDYYETTTYTFSEETTHKRNFKMQVYLIDAINQLTLFQQEYSAISQWPYDLTQHFDPNSLSFWQTDYGYAIDLKINEAVRDVRQALYCQPTMATIIAKYNDQLVMNLGHRNGVEKGDKFQLIRSQFLSHQNSQLPNSIYLPDDILLSVVSVQADRAILKANDPIDMSNIQIRDMLTPADKMTLQRLQPQTTASNPTNRSVY
ncbi:flagellar biosynthesis protein FlgT [Psychromonas sp. B3M02]|uniref:flagellar assembly protein T N-terminal domain-containing protein n=1 Tax=unclassified Psychromonas TaxID=2614957 RepID=UPI000DE859FF|nr:flagellar assembly protein T N-terminal domain-containing protein [Psychromonas sp. B3M02]RBW46560.1 flagellar biosynthesis protein FlgT [Psychromonas sp. B3M02]